MNPDDFHGPPQAPYAYPPVRRLRAHAARARAGDGARHLRPRDPLHAPAHRGDRCRPLPPRVSQTGAATRSRSSYPFTLEAFEYGAIGPVLLLLIALVWRYRDTHWRHCSGDGRRGRAEALPLAAALRGSRSPAVIRAAVAAAGIALALALVSWSALGFAGIGELPAAARQARRGRGRELVLGVRHPPRARAPGDGVEARCDRRGRCTARRSHGERLRHPESTRPSATAARSASPSQPRSS